MGRSTTQVSATSVALTAKQRALQDGTPKWLQPGMPRACYAMISNNTASNQGGVVFYDKYFQATRAVGYMESPTSPGVNSEGVYNYFPPSSTFYATNQLSSFTVTQTAQASTSTHHIGGTHSAGMFGNATLDVYSNATHNSTRVRNNDALSKAYLNTMVVDSDHADKLIVYTLDQGVFRAKSLLNGDHVFDYHGTTGFTIPLLSTGMRGSASYNAVRKELIILNLPTDSASGTLYTYRGIDFDRFPSPAAAFAAAGVTRNDWPLTISSYAGGYTESYHKMLPVLCDNGDIYFTSMRPHSGIRLYKCTRNTNGSVLLSSFVGAKTLTTTYGLDNGASQGQRRIMSRDGGAVLCFCPYYYYECGVQTWLIDKRESSYLDTNFFDSTGSGNGMQPMPYGDSGFAEFYARNVYASNPTGGYITAFVERNGAGVMGQSNGAIYLPYFTYPNTTNYPGMTQVVDFNLLTNQTLV